MADPVMPEKMRVIAGAMGIELSGSETGKQLGELVAEAIRELMRAVGLKSLAAMGFSREDVVSFVPDVVSNHLSSFCPVKVTEDVAGKLLADIYDSYQ